MSEEPVLIRRIEMYFDAERKPVKKIQEASFKYVTLYDEEGELTDQYRVEIVDGIDPELEEEATEEFREEEHPREEHGKFTDKGGGVQKKVDKTIESGKSIISRLNKYGAYTGIQSLYREAKIDVKNDDTNYMGKPIRNMSEYKEWNRQIDLFKQHVNNNKVLKKIYTGYEKQVEDYNKELDIKYEKADTFHRGTSFHELNGYIKDQCLSCDYYDWNTNEKGRAYDFLSLSMNEGEIKSLYNFGVIIEFNGDDVRNNGKRVEYKAEPVPFPAQKSKLPKTIKNLEGYDKPYDAYFADEQEVRIPTGMKLSDVKIDKITFDVAKQAGAFLNEIDPELLKSYQKIWDKDSYDYKVGTTKSGKEWFNQNKEKVLKAVKDKYGTLTDNIEVEWSW